MHEKNHVLREIEEEIMEALFDISISKKAGERIKMGEILDKIGQDIAKTQLTNIVRRKLEPEPLCYVDYIPYDGILLTKEGYKVARRIARNHRLAEAMLYQIFDVPFSELHEQACNIEHGISDLLAEYIYKKLKDKKTPFGMPIPMGEIEDFGCNDPSLLDISSGKKVILTRIDSHTSNTASELEPYDINHVGVKMLVKEQDEEGVLVELDKTEHKIPHRLSKNLCVRYEE